MHYADLHDWLLMGGYGWFVWPSYAIALLVLLANLIHPLYRHRRLLEKLHNRRGKPL